MIFKILNKDGKLIANAIYLGSATSNAVDNEIVVLRNSLMSKNIVRDKKWNECSWIEGIRSSLIDKGYVKEHNEMYYIFDKPYIFNSPGAAASTVLGRITSNAWDFFTNNEERTLRSIYKINKDQKAQNKVEKRNIEKSKVGQQDLNNSEKNTMYKESDSNRIKKITEILKSEHYKEKQKLKTDNIFSNNPQANAMLIDLNRYPEMFFIGCLMDRQISAEKAWTIPYYIYKHFGTLKFDVLGKITLNEWETFFETENLHRFNKIMSKLLFKAIIKVNEDFNGCVTNIWNHDNAAEVVKRFKSFEGIGPKIGTMAVNILYRDFNIDFNDLSGIDISPDIQVLKVFYRLRLTNDPRNTTELIIKAREMEPDFPGIFDLKAWQIGRTVCHNTEPNCTDCPLNNYCMKQGL